MNNFYAMSLSERKPVTPKPHLLRAAVALLLFGGIMYATALVAHSESRVNPAAISQQQ
jgi:hypothetical protein